MEGFAQAQGPAGVPELPKVTGLIWCLAGKLKEWGLILYGTAEHPHHTFLKPELLEDEEDYTGNDQEEKAGLLSLLFLGNSHQCHVHQWGCSWWGCGCTSSFAGKS
jgi:hypothetical protein